MSGMVRATGTTHSRSSGRRNRSQGNQHAWWYPEREGPEYGLWESNLNVITRNDRGQGFDPIYGGPQLRGFLCKVYRAEEAP